MSIATALAVAPPLRSNCRSTINTEPMKKILIVDDDENLLSACRREFRRQFHIETARSPEEALAALRSGSFGVILSDLRMAGPRDGINLLARVKDESPEVVRMLMTGFADLQMAIDAVNKGNIFRFLTKPCPFEVLGQAFRDGRQFHDLAQAKFQLLEWQFRHPQK